MPRPALHILHENGDPKGARPPILLIHGAWHGAWCWAEHFIGYFAKAGYEVLAPDLRGHGESPAVKPMRWNRISDYVEDVLSVIDGLERPPVLIGHSMGGFVSQHCMRRTDRLAGVVLLATVPHYGVISTTAKIALTRPIDFAEVNLRWTLYPLVRRQERAQHMFFESQIDPATIGRFHESLCDESYLAFLDMLAFQLPGHYAGSLPTLVVGGAEDTLFSPASQQSTARRYGAQCRIIDHAPHDLMLASQWREAAEIIRMWISDRNPQ